MTGIKQQNRNVKLIRTHLLALGLCLLTSGWANASPKTPWYEVPGLGFLTVDQYLQGRLYNENNISQETIDALNAIFTKFINDYAINGYLIHETIDICSCAARAMIRDMVKATGATFKGFIHLAERDPKAHPKQDTHVVGVLEEGGQLIGVDQNWIVDFEEYGHQFKYARWHPSSPNPYNTSTGLEFLPNNHKELEWVSFTDFHSKLKNEFQSLQFRPSELAYKTYSVILKKIRQRTKSAIKKYQNSTFDTNEFVDFFNEKRFKARIFSLINLHLKKAASDPFEIEADYNKFVACSKTTP